MKAVERKSMWHHVVFSASVCSVLLAILVIRSDVPGTLLAAFIGLYIAGNTLLHVIHKDFRKEALYEYVLVGLAVGIVLLGAFRH